MYGNYDHHQDNTSPLFRNTRSRLYKKRSSFEDDPSYGNQQSPPNSAQAWKQKGNEAFKQHDYDKAIQYYSKAIEINPGESQFYSNRSKCYQKKLLLEKSLKDAETACELQEQNIKAHYICGCILAQLGKKDINKMNKAQNRLKKALRLCRTRSAQQFEEEISIKLFRLKKLVWFRNKEKQIQELQLERKIMKKAFDNKQINQRQYNRIVERIENRIQQSKNTKQIPDHLICKITLMLMEDPVVSEAGFSYQRQVLEEHYKLKGPIEPITRKQVTGKIFPNQALKQAIQIFLKDNPWAYEQEKCQNYQDIIFI